MHSEKVRERAGFTLVEVLVVLGIIALISAIAIPGLARMGAFSRDEFKRAVTQVDSVLRAAQIYATTYHVNTAVVYSMDHYDRSEALTGTPVAVASPIIDSMTSAQVRQIEAAAVMYELPSSMGLNLAGLYVPIPGDLGEFQTLPTGMSIPLQNPEALGPGGYDPLYADTSYSNYQPGSPGQKIANLGMAPVAVALGVPVGMTNAEFIAFAADSTNFLTVNFPAHVFKPSGRMSVPGSGQERFTLYIAPGADRPIEERAVDPDDPNEFRADGSSNMRYRRIYLHKSTGRVSVPDAQ